MANLSERLRALADKLTPNTCVSEEWRAVHDAANLIDRLTVEGLAGRLEMAFHEWRLPQPGTREPFNVFFAQALLAYITTPSVEESK